MNIFAKSSKWVSGFFGPSRIRVFGSLSWLVKIFAKRHTSVYIRRDIVAMLLHNNYE